MTYEFVRFAIDLAGMQPTREEFAWAEVELTLANLDAGTNHNVRVPVCIQFDDSQSLGEAKQRALEQTRDMLAAALDVVRGHDLGSLYRLQKEGEERETKRLNAESEQIAAQLFTAEKK